PVAAAKRVLIRSGLWVILMSVLLIEFYPGTGMTPASLMSSATYVGITSNKNELGMISLTWGLGFLWCFFDALNRKMKGTRDTTAALGHLTISGISLCLAILSDSATSRSLFYLGAALMTLTSMRWVYKRKFLVHLVTLSAIGAVLTVVFILPSM